MRKLLLIVFIAALGIAGAALAQDTDYFPMDTGRAWVFDDNAVETITAIGKPEPADGMGPNGVLEGVYLFTYTAYQYESRVFFANGPAVYEHTGRHVRLWYDFEAHPGDSWPLAWQPTLDTGPQTGDGAAQPAQPPADITTDAVMHLVETGVAVSVPSGSYEMCMHFRMERPGGVTVDEWFAPGIGCIKRVWTTAAGMREQKLVRFTPATDTRPPVKLDVRLDAIRYKPGDDLAIEITAFNVTDSPVMLTFPSSLEADYSIDDAYTWSRGKAFTTQAVTVTIPAHDTHRWLFTHTVDDFAIPAGRHVITASLNGYDMTARMDFIVGALRPEIEQGLTLAAATDKDTYLTGEPIRVSLTATNTTGSDITLNIAGNDPLTLSINARFDEHDPTTTIMKSTTPLSIPAGDSLTFSETLDADMFMPRAGAYTLLVGITGYTGYAKTDFTVMPDVKYGTITGSVAGYSIQTDDTAPLAGIPVRLRSVILKSQQPSFLVNTPPGVAEWTVTTGPQGAFSFPDIPLGTFYTLLVEAEGYGPFQMTVRAVTGDTLCDIVLKPLTSTAETPRNYKQGRFDEGIGVVFGADQSAYRPDSPFRAFLVVINEREEPVTFTFDDETRVRWGIAEVAGATVWTGTTTGTGTELVLAPGEKKEYVLEGSFADAVPGAGGKYALSGVLAFSSCSVTDLAEKGLGGFVRIVVAPGESERVEAQSHRNQMTIELKEKVRADLEIRLKNDDVQGGVTISEFSENPHPSLDDHRFIKMIEIDADSTIRANVDTAYVRIYYDPADFGAGFDPLKLKIAHWSDNTSASADDDDALTWDSGDFSPNAWDAATFDPSGEGRSWKLPPCRIDTINQYVEAPTASFSSFGLFIDETSTGVADDTAAPAVFALNQNSPNPFNPATVIEFVLPGAGTTRLIVYNIAGQEVTRLVDGRLGAGVHRVVFDGSRLASGVYFYRLDTPGFTGTRKMLLIK